MSDHPSIIRPHSELWAVASGGFEGEGSGPPHRSWASHEKGDSNEKMDTVDTILIHSANIASSTGWAKNRATDQAIFKGKLGAIAPAVK